MKLQNRLLVCVGLIALAGASSVLAGNQPGAVTLSFNDAYYKFDSKRRVDSTSMPNFTLAYDITDRWAAEGTIGVLNSELSANLSTGEVEGDPAHGMLYTIDGIYRFNSYKIVQPYIEAGIGIVGLDPSGTTSTQQGIINAGVGAQAFFDKSLALRAEVRDVCATTGSGFNDYFVNFGISYIIGV